MRRDNEWRTSLMELVARFDGRGCECRRARRSPCNLVSRCARKAQLEESARLISQLRQFGLKDARIAGYAETDRPNISRLAGGHDEPRLGFARLTRVIEGLRKAVLDTRERYLAMSVVEEAVRVKTLDFCSDHGNTDKLAQEADATLRSILVSIALNRPAKAKKRLPKGVHALVAQLGDPADNTFIIHHADPAGLGDAASLQVCDSIIHELYHVIYRLTDRRDRIAKKIRRGAPPPLRLS
jgi:hypothetical protein